MCLANSPLLEVHFIKFGTNGKFPPHFERFPALRGPTSGGSTVSGSKPIHQLYIQVAKNIHRKSAAQEKLETQLTAHLSKLFDIAHGYWQKLTKIHADRQYFVDQRGPWMMLMSIEDINFRRTAEKCLSESCLSNSIK